MHNGACSLTPRRARRVYKAAEEIQEEADGMGPDALGAGWGTRWGRSHGLADGHRRTAGAAPGARRSGRRESAEGGCGNSWLLLWIRRTGPF